MVTGGRDGGGDGVVAMDLSNLHAVSAVDGARLIRDGVITSEQLVGACLERVRAVDEDVQAWAFLDPQFALMQARRADEVRLSGQVIGALHGVPVGLKDIIDTSDMPTENGSALHAGRTPSRDASVTAMLRAAGGVFIGKKGRRGFFPPGPGEKRNPPPPRP